MTDAPRLRVVIDARLVSGDAGGVEGVVIGLASGLSGLEGGSEEYLFVAWRGLESWIAPYISGSARLVVQSPPWRMRTASGLPSLATAWRRLRRPWPTAGPPATDRLVDSLRPDVIHFPFQRGFLTGSPNVFHPHDLQHVHLPALFSKDQRRQREIWYGALCRNASMVAVATTWTKHDVERHFDLPPEKVRVVPLAPPTAAYAGGSAPDVEDLRRRLGLPPAYLLYAAQTWPHKNHLRLLDALALLRRRDGLTVPLVAPGRQTSQFPEIQRHAAELGLGDQVRWPGFVTTGDLLGLYASARAVVVPSKFEAASAPLWEAFREGIPVACSNVTSLPEQAGDAALIFDPDDIGDMADAIRTLWNDESARARLVAAGRRRVADLSWDRTARTFRAHYRRLAGRPLAHDDVELASAPPPL